MKRVTFVLLSAVVLPTLMGAAQEAIAGGDSHPDMIQRAEAVKNLKWGMFVCWSFSTFSGKEHTVEKDLPPSFFKAQTVDTDQWARTAKEAGMGYILFLTKHVDGFCLWDTRTTQHKVTNAPLRKDVLKLLRQSCDKYGIKLALYFCEGDIFGNRPDVKKAQLKELLTQYGDIEYLWLDHGFRASDGGLSHVETAAWCRQWQPRTLIGFNHGQPAGEISLREHGSPGPLGDQRHAGYNKENESSYKGYLLAEFTYPILPAHKGGANWFYSLPEHDGLCASAEQLYRHYRGAVKYGNIFSVDVGPDYEGRLRDIDVRTLLQVGKMIENTPPMLPSLAEGKPVRASSIWSAEYDASKALDGDESTRWGATSGSRSGWLEVDLLSEQTIEGVTIVENSFPRTLAFAVEVERGGVWKKIAEGKVVGKEQRLMFPAVKARLLRLNILKASGEPTINEFYVHGVKQ